MVVYWDLAALVNGAADYLLLLSAARLAGRTVPRLRLLGAAAFGAAYAVLRLVLPCSPWLTAAAFVGMALLAFRGTGRALKLGLLTLLLSCALGGGVMLLGRCVGSLARVARGVIFAQLPWGVLLGAMGVTYLLLSTVFRGGARHDGGELLRVTLTRGGKTVTLRLLHDSGNLLTDPLTGESVPVIGQSALRALLPEREEGYITLSCTTAGGSGTLRAFYCDSVRVNGRDLGRRLVAVSPDIYGDSGFQGVWRMEEQEGAHEWFRRLWNRLCAWLARHGLLPRAGIFYIGGSDSLPPPLSREVEAEMLARLDEGDFEVRQILIEHNLRLVAYIARRFDNTGINIEDLISIGTIGLIKAINTYRSDKNIKLATYASRCIENEILMYLRKNANQKVEVSFDEPLNTDWDGNELLLSDILGTDGDTVLRPIEDDVDRQLLTTAVSRLSEREREIITLRFGLGGREEKTQKEVADYLGISQSYISRLEKRIIARLKREILKMS